MAQNSVPGERKRLTKRRGATPQRTRANAPLEAGLQAGLAVHQVAIGGVDLKSGTITFVEGKYPPYFAWSDRIEWVQADHFVPLEGQVFASSCLWPTATGEADGLYGEAGDDILDGGTGMDIFGLHPNDAALEQEAGELLKAARNAEGDPSIRSVRRRFEESVFSGAVDALGGAGAIGIAVRDEADLLRAIGLGFPASVLASLREVGFHADDLEGVIAPRRTLARRKASGQRLTRVESDAAWRVAHVLSLGARVLRGPEAALAWLRRPKAALGDQTPIDLIETAVGAQAVERLLFQLEWGDVA